MTTYGSGCWEDSRFHRVSGEVTWLPTEATWETAGATWGSGWLWETGDRGQSGAGRTAAKPDMASPDDLQAPQVSRQQDSRPRTLGHYISRRPRGLGTGHREKGDSGEPCLWLPEPQKDAKGSWDWRGGKGDARGVWATRGSPDPPRAGGGGRPGLGTQAATLRAGSGRGRGRVTCAAERAQRQQQPERRGRGPHGPPGSRRRAPLAPAPPPPAPLSSALRRRLQTAPGLSARPPCTWPELRGPRRRRGSCAPARVPSRRRLGQRQLPAAPPASSRVSEPSREEGREEGGGGEQPGGRRREEDRKGGGGRRGREEGGGGKRRRNGARRRGRRMELGREGD